MRDAEVAWLRLRRQRLVGTPLASPEAALGWLGASQAQEFAVAKWSLAQRSRGAVTEAQLDRLLDEGRILRLHVLRPTWHFVRAADLRWIVAATAPRVHALNAYAYRQFGIDDDRLIDRTHGILRKALAGGQTLTRKEVAVRFAEGGVVAEGTRLAYLLMRAELDLVVCSGPRRGKQHTYALVDERVPPAPALSRDEALAELCRRYFTSHGPATLKDFLWWSSLTAAEARRGLEMLGSEIARLVAGDRTYWLCDPPPRRARPEAPAVHLLQSYDEYMVAYTESKAVLAAAGLPGLPRGPAMFLHAIVRDGRVVGHWRRVPSSGKAGAVIEGILSKPFDRDARRALHEEVERYGRFLQQPVRLTTSRAATRRPSPAASTAFSKRV
jgi:hypothetical protein